MQVGVKMLEAGCTNIGKLCVDKMKREMGEKIYANALLLSLQIIYH